MKQPVHSPADCAGEMLEVVPLVMRALRAEVRKRRTPELSVPQFRALAFVGRNGGAKLADVADFLGLTPPSASKLIDGLVTAKLVSRDIHAGDRRRITLALSPAGRREFQAVRTQAREYLARKIRHLPEKDRERLFGAMGDLRAAFERETPPEVTNGSTARNAVPGARVKKKRRHASVRNRQHV